MSEMRATSCSECNLALGFFSRPHLSGLAFTPASGLLNSANRSSSGLSNRIIALV